MSAEITEDEFTVSDELYEIAEATHSDGTVDVEIYDFEKVGDGKVAVKFRTPTLEKEHEIMQWPKKDSPEYKFVRICRATVGSLAGAKWLKQDGAQIKADPEDWEIEAELGTIGKVKQKVSEYSVRQFVGDVVVAGLTSILLAGVITVVGVPLLGMATLAGAVSVSGSFGSYAGMWALGAIISLVFAGIVEAAMDAR